jgi:hypothetical protein
MRRTSALLVAIGCAAAHGAQVPDIKIIGDLRPSLLSRNGNGTRFQWYDERGKHSTLGLLLTLEPGLMAQVTQRLQRIPNDPDTDSLDEYWVEDPGYWRIGKQVIPFGRESLIRMIAPAVRGETTLVFDDTPASLVALDAGTRRARGVVARLGKRLRMSVAFGNHFGIAAGDLVDFRNPEDSPGAGRGYQVLVGADCFWKLDPFVTLAAEYLAMRSGETALDREEDASELGLNVRWRGLPLVVDLAWCRLWRVETNAYRIEAIYGLYDRITLSARVRWLDGHWRDAGLSLRIRL